MTEIGVENADPVVAQANYFKVSSEGAAWGPRAIPDYELIHIVAGEFAYDNLRTGATAIIADGDTLCIPPGERHVFRHVRSFSYGAVIACVHLEFAKVGSRLAGDYVLVPEPPLVTRTRGSIPIHQLFRNARDVFEGYGTHRNALLNVIAKEIYLRMAESWGEGGQPRISRRTELMLKMMRQSFPKTVSRNELGRRFGLTPEHVNAIFKSELGMTPTEISHRIRITQACRFIQEDGLTLQQTAEECGFRDEYHFSRIFKKVMGIPPGKFAGK